MFRIRVYQLSLTAIKKSSNAKIISKPPSHTRKYGKESRGDFHHQLFEDDARQVDCVNKKDVPEKTYKGEEPLKLLKQRLWPTKSVYRHAKPKPNEMDVPNLKLEIKLRQEAINQKMRDAILIHEELCRRESMISARPQTEFPHPYVSATLMAVGTGMCLGSLCFYGMKYTKDRRAENDKEALWPDYIEKRMQTIFSYYGKSMLFALFGAAVALRFRKFRILVARYHYGLVLAGLVGLIDTGTLLQVHEYDDGCPGKLSHFCEHFLLQGVVIASLCLIGGPVMYRLLWYTFGALEAVSLLAITSPNEDTFLKTLPFGFLLGTMVADGLGVMLLPSVPSLTKGMQTFKGYKFYGLLLLVYLYFYSDTLLIEGHAKHFPLITNQEFDPIAAMLIDYEQIYSFLVELPLQFVRELFPQSQTEEDEGDEDLLAKLEARRMLEDKKNRLKYELTCPNTSKSTNT